MPGAKATSRSAALRTPDSTTNERSVSAYTPGGSYPAPITDIRALFVAGRRSHSLHSRPDYRAV